jgi:integrase
MKSLAQHLQNYLTLRRSLGFKLRQADCLLRQFIRFAGEQRVIRLVRTARRLPSAEGLKGPALSTLLGLVAVTGMRIGEAIALDRQDVDLSQGLLTIQHPKGDRVRLIPVHASTCTMLRRFERLRNRICPHPTRFDCSWLLPRSVSAKRPRC